MHRRCPETPAPQSRASLAAMVRCPCHRTRRPVSTRRLGARVDQGAHKAGSENQAMPAHPAWTAPPASMAAASP